MKNNILGVNKTLNFIKYKFLDKNKKLGDRLIINIHKENHLYREINLTINEVDFELINDSKISSGYFDIDWSKRKKVYMGGKVTTIEFTSDYY